MTRIRSRIFLWFLSLPWVRDMLLNLGGNAEGVCPHGVPEPETCTMCHVDAGKIGFT